MPKAKPTIEQRAQEEAQYAVWYPSEDGGSDLISASGNVYHVTWYNCNCTYAQIHTHDACKHILMYRARFPEGRTDRPT